jgi:hypothetical protein
MNNARTDFEAAISNGDWEGVRAFYEHIYQTQAPEPPLEGGIDGNLDSFRKQLKADVMDCLQSLRMDSERRTNTEMVQELGQTSKSNFDTPSPSDESKTKFITFSVPEENRPGYKEAIGRLNNERSKQEVHRKPYVPDMRVCSSCGKDYDFKKEYPGGRMSERDAELCNKCQLPGIKTKKS